MERVTKRSKRGKLLRYGHTWRNTFSDPEKHFPWLKQKKCVRFKKTKQRTSKSFGGRQKGGLAEGSIC